MFRFNPITFPVRFARMIVAAYGVKSKHCTLTFKKKPLTFDKCYKNNETRDAGY